MADVLVARTATLVLVFRLPVRGAFRKEIEEVPDRAEIITRPERRVRDADDFSTLFLEHGHARQPAVVAPIAHVAGEGGIAMRHHGKRQPRDALNFSCACGSSGDATTKAARFSMCGSKPLKPSAHKVQ